MSTRTSIQPLHALCIFVYLVASFLQVRGCEFESVKSNRPGGYSVLFTVPIETNINDWTMDLAFSTPISSLKVWGVDVSVKDERILNLTSKVNTKKGFELDPSARGLNISYSSISGLPEIERAVFNKQTICMRGVTARTGESLIDTSTLGDKRLIFNININSLLPSTASTRRSTKIPKKQVTPQSTSSSTSRYASGTTTTRKPTTTKKPPQSTSTTSRTTTTKKYTTVTTKPTGITTTKKPTQQQLLKIAVAKLQQTVKQLQRQIGQLTSASNKTQQAVQRQNVQIDQLTTKSNETRQTVQSLSDQIGQLTTNFNETQQTVQRQNVQIDQLTTKSNETQLTVQLQNVLIDQLTTNSNETQQTVQFHSLQIEQFQPQIDQLTTNVNETQQAVQLQIYQLTTNFNETQQTVQLQNVLIDQLTTNSSETQQTVQLQKLQIEQFQPQIDQLTTKSNETQLIVQLQNVLIDQLTANSSETKQTVQSQNAQIERLQGQIDQLTSKSDEDPPLLLYRSCQELRSFEPGSASGGYWIDPDGVAVGDPPIYVQCDMTTGSTLISHNSEESMQTGRCADPGCYSRSVTYNATMRQIVALTQLSQSCRQFFKFDCFSVPFQFNSVAQAWWNDRNGVPQYYWAGSSTSVHTCQCGIDGNCTSANVKCNCDALTAAQLSDKGYITSKDALPATKLNFGRTLANNTYGNHTLGKLECSGRVTVNTMPVSCVDLWKIGHTLNGFYEVKGYRNIGSVYCDFTKLPGDPGVETAVGVVDVKSSPVYFHVQRNTNFYVIGTIPFQIERLNVGGGMNINSGIFTAPRSGIYFFSFHCLKNAPANPLYVDLYQNSNLITTAYGESYYGFVTATLSSTLNLNSGDRISLRLRQGEIDDNGASFSNFNGILLQEYI